MPAMRMIVLLLLFFSSFCFAQNKVNEKGQKYGYWKTQRIDDKNVTEEGYYIVRAITQYDSASMEQSPYDTLIQFLDVRHLGALVRILAYNYATDSFSVKDGYWKTYDCCRMMTEEYKRGILLESCGFDSGHVKVSCHQTNYEKGVTTAMSYLDDRIFRQTITHNKSKSRRVDTVYYPDAALGIVNAEPTLVTNFVTKPIDTQIITLYGRENTRIKTIKGNDNIKLFSRDHRQVKFPFTIGRGDSLSLLIEYKPSPSTYSRTDTINILTSDGNYKIICTDKSSHIDYENIIKIKELSLSKSQDKRLIVRGCGTASDIYFYQGETKVKSAGVRYDNPISISVTELPSGIYKVVYITDCSRSGETKLTITD